MKLKIVSKIKKFLDKIDITILNISLKELLKVYITNIRKKRIMTQASSISWSFFFSLFSFILFLLSILPYLPHYEDVYKYIFYNLFSRMLPSDMHNEVIEYIETVIIPKIESVSSFTILLVLFSATRGTYSIVSYFNEGENINIVKEYIYSFFITLGFVMAIILFILGIYYSEIVLKLLLPEYQKYWWISNLTLIIGYFSFPLFYGLTLSLFYYLCCIKITKWKYAIPGTIFTTILFLLTTYGFAFYVVQFANYNVLYGSIGSMILLMIWVQINVMIILLGNEFNLSIRKLN